jgi:hypothetical protein
MTDSASQLAEREYVAAMGQELGELFYRLRNEHIWLHRMWNEYVLLFASRQERIDLLNESAGAFFQIVEECLWQQTLLQITRITDREKSAGKENLTVQSLPSLVPTTIGNEVMNMLKRCLERCEFARDWRNRHIAHCDLSLALSLQAVPLESVSQQKVGEALGSISMLLNTVERYYRHSEVKYELACPLLNAESLLEVLRDGLEFQDRRRKRFESGKPDPEDLNPPSAV